MAVMMMTVGNVWGAITPSTPTVTDGVYQIGTAEELWWFAQNAAASANAKLTDDIDLGSYSFSWSYPNR